MAVEVDEEADIASSPPVNTTMTVPDKPIDYLKVPSQIEDLPPVYAW